MDKSEYIKLERNSNDILSVIFIKGNVFMFRMLYAVSSVISFLALYMKYSNILISVTGSISATIVVMILIRLVFRFGVSKDFLGNLYRDNVSIKLTFHGVYIKKDLIKE